MIASVTSLMRALTLTAIRAAIEADTALLSSARP
jgi:hypothetical protein